MPVESTFEVSASWKSTVRASRKTRPLVSHLLTLSRHLLNAKLSQSMLLSHLSERERAVMASKAAEDKKEDKTAALDKLENLEEDDEFEEFDEGARSILPCEPVRAHNTPPIPH